MTNFIHFHKSGASVLIAAILTLAGMTPVQAAPLAYSFSGLTTAGSLLNLGAGLVDVGGVNFTVTGMTTDDIDQTPTSDGLGLFNATSTYDFGAFGTFTTDTGGDTYFQNCSSPAGITCVGLFNGSTGFLLGFPVIAGDPDFGLAIGTPSGAFLVGSEFRFLANDAGDQMFVNAASFSNMSIQAVPEPGMVSLFGLGLAVLAWRRRTQS
jgi:hypothetical protein